jgi:hypothetical protein
VIVAVLVVGLVLGLGWSLVRRGRGGRGAAAAVPPSTVVSVDPGPRSLRGLRGSGGRM